VEVESDPQRPQRPRHTGTLLWARLQADLRSVELGLRLLGLAARRPVLWRLLAGLALEFPPGRAYRLAREAGEQIFGETPLWSAFAILRDARVRAGQRLVELGCGPARLSLVGASLFGLRCEGIERISAFVHRGNRLAQRLGVAVAYREQDLSRWSPCGEDWVYVAGTAFAEPLRRRLAQKLARSEATVLSVTLPLPIPSHPPRPLGSYRFLWGFDRVFVQAPG
jgi:hypothetical protein